MGRRHGTKRGTACAIAFAALLAMYGARAASAASPSAAADAARVAALPDAAFGDLVLAPVRVRTGVDEVRPQLDPEQPLQDVYPSAGLIDYAILIVPDPRVPRHRRSYELALRSVIAGMNDADYVLDRYYFPWQGYGGDKAGAGQGDRWAAKDQADDGRYGALVFRNDRWRAERGAENTAPATRLRVLYVVAETVTYGVQRDAMRNALYRVADEVEGIALLERINGGPPHGAAHRYIEPPRRADANNGVPEGRLLVIGPNFSGSVGGLESIASAARGVERFPVPAAITARLGVLRQLIARVQGSDDPAAGAVSRYRRFVLDFERTLEQRTWPVVDALLSTAPMPYPIRDCAGGDRRDTTREIECEIALVSNYFYYSKINYYIKSLSGQAAGAAGSPGVAKLPGIAAVSPSATVASNERINDFRPGVFALYSLAADDYVKLKGVLDYLDAASPRAPLRVALLYETSSFGRGAYESLRDTRREFLYATFPPNIADLRKRFRDKDAAAKRNVGIISLTTDERYLAIEESAENGNEYPDGGTSSLTSVSADQQMRQMLSALRDRDAPPNVVIVAATDVRDRLYLFDRVSRELPNATLVDLEADLLLAHPDYVHATRGALMVSSAVLTSEPDPAGSDTAGAYHRGRTPAPCTGRGETVPVASFDSDRQALLFELVRCLGAPYLREPTPLLYAIGREGPVRMGVDEPQVGAWAQARVGLSHPLAAIYGVGVLLPALVLLLCAMRKSFARESWQLADGPRGAAPWWYHARASCPTMTLWLVGIGVVVVVLQPFVQQYIGVRSYIGASAGCAWRLLWLQGWLCALAASVLWVDAALAARRAGERSTRSLALPFGVPLALAALGGADAAGAAGQLLPLRATFLWWLQLQLWIIAVLALALCLTLVRRLRRWAFYAETLVRAARKEDLADWASIAGAKPRFVATPIEAGLRSGMYRVYGSTAETDMRRELLALEAAFQDGLAPRLALRRLFWPSLNAIALAAFAIVLAYFGIILLAWLYPVPGRGVPLLIGLVVAVLGTVLLIVNAIALERGALLSRLFCGTDKGLQISSHLLTIVTGPVLLLLLSILAADQPGVLEWSGGIVKIFNGR